ncbi:MAG: hypothetical protein SNJ75_00840 [Gemmataceae bacterium]
MSFDPNLHDDVDARRHPSRRDIASSYTRPPGIVMLICAVLNVPAILFCAGTLFWHLRMNVDDFVANQQEVKPVMRGIGFDNDQLLRDPASSLMQIRVTYGVLTVFLSFTTLLVFLGGIMMMRLQGYVLSLISAIVLTLPCTTLCCLVGQAVGIWALMVLLTTWVREEFR